MSPRSTPPLRHGLRIVSVIASGAGAQWFPRMCAGLAAHGHRVSAIVSSQPGDLAERVAEAGVPCMAADLSLRRPLAASASHRELLSYPGHAMHVARSVGALARLLRRLRPDVVISFQSNTMLLGRPAARLARVPLHLSAVTSPLSLEAPLTRWIDRAMVPLDGAVLAGSEYIRELYCDMGVARERVDVVYYGADPERFDPQRAQPARAREQIGVPAGVPLVGHIAHFYAPIGGPAVPATIRGRGIKGHETLLEAATIVLARRPAVRFVLAGGAYRAPAEAYRDRIERLARDLGIRDSVVFAGEVRDVPDLLAALDVAVQPSRCENLGGTIESLMMGTPTVATRVGGMPEAVIDGRTGLLVDPDDAAQLAAAILRLLDDRGLAAELAATGRTHVLERLTFGRSVEDLERAVRERWMPHRFRRASGRS